MSPRLQFCGPARQRGAIGLMAALTLTLALAFMLLVVDTGRLYLEKRSLQRVADMAALEAATRGETVPAAQPLTPMPRPARNEMVSPFPPLDAYWLWRVVR